MPRTPLLQQVSDLVATVAAAGRDDRSATPVSRRDLLRAAGVGALGLGVAACDSPTMLAPAPVDPTLGRRDGKASATSARVAIVGAGLAGLTAAYRLRQAGVRASVFEANTRLGGRCWTNRTAFPGQIAEHGGELIDQWHGNIRALARELGLTLDNVLAAEANGTEPFYWFGGGHYSVRDAANDMKAVWQPLKRDYVEAGYPTLYTSYTGRGRELDAMSVAQWIDTRVPDGRASRLGKLLEVAYTIEYGAEATEQSALNLVYLLGGVGQGNVRLFGKSDEKYKVRGGNDQIVTRLASQLGDAIGTGVVLRAITRVGSAYRLDFDGRASVIADRVVLALPFSVLRERVDFSGADFSTTKVQAIEELGMGSNAKLALQFSSRVWRSGGCNGDSFSETGYQATWEVTRAQQGAEGILVNYTGGDVSDAQSGRLPSALAGDFLAQAEPVIPGLSAAYTGRVWFNDWVKEPWTLGSYSYYKPGQYTRFGGAEAEVSGACHFAGEHTSTDSQGYLNGAVESGERAAREVLSALGVKKA